MCIDVLLDMNSTYMENSMGTILFFNKYVLKDHTLYLNNSYTTVALLILFDASD